MLFSSTSVKFQRIMEGIDDDKLDISRTLIFYQDGFNFKSIQKRFKQITKIRMNDSPNKIAEIIELFIKLHKLSSKYKNQSGVMLCIIFLMKTFVTNSKTILVL